MSTDVIRPALEKHPRRDELARVLRIAALSAADERRARFADGLEELMREAKLEADDGKIGAFNVLRALQRTEPPVADGRHMMAALLARGIALEPPADDRAADRTAEALAWLAAHTYLDALSVIDAELDVEDAARLWNALARLVREADARGTARGRAEALAAAAALAQSGSVAAESARRTLAGELTDRLIARVISGAGAGAAPLPAPGDGASVRGEMVPAPLGPVALFFWCASGLILVRYLALFVARVLLRSRRPAELRVAPGGVTVETKLDVLGRTVREQRLHVPLANLARASRDVRYPRLAMYAGLGTLALGTFFGVSLITDGARAGSPSLLAIGALIFALGVAIDFALSSLWPSRRGVHRVVLVPRKGRALALAVEDVHAADQALRSIERTAASPARS